MSPRYHVWEIREVRGSEMALQEVIDALMARAFLLQGPLRSLRQAGCTVHLEIVNWISPVDSHGPGFSLPSPDVAFLADIGADVDVDQYIG